MLVIFEFFLVLGYRGRDCSVDTSRPPMITIPDLGACSVDKDDCTSTVALSVTNIDINDQMRCSVEYSKVREHFCLSETKSLSVVLKN